MNCSYFIHFPWFAFILCSTESAWSIDSWVRCTRVCLEESLDPCSGSNQGSLFLLSFHTCQKKRTNLDSNGTRRNILLKTDNIGRGYAWDILYLTEINRWSNTLKIMSMCVCFLRTPSLYFFDTHGNYEAAWSLKDKDVERSGRMRWILSSSFSTDFLFSLMVWFQFIRPHYKLQNLLKAQKGVHFKFSAASVSPLLQFLYRCLHAAEGPSCFNH